MYILKFVVFHTLSIIEMMVMHLFLNKKKIRNLLLFDL